MLHRNYPIQSATEADVYKIFEFAQGRYEASRINGPEIKLPWWKKNPNIFYVIHDQESNVCANINLLPLKEACYRKVMKGEIPEREIRAEDIFTIEENHLVQYIYVEGFNCKYKNFAYNIIANFESLISNLIDHSHNEIIIGGIGGTKEGARIMRNLGFKITSSNEGLLGKYSFEVNYGVLLNQITSRLNIK